MRDDANKRFNKLKNYGEKHIFDTVKIKYFAVSLPDLLIRDEDLQIRNTLHCWYLIGLGCMGPGLTKKAVEFFTKIPETDIILVQEFI